MTHGAGETFPRSSRLTLAGDYKQVFQRNHRVSDDCFTLLVAKQDSQQPRLGFAIAKKQIKRAVDRNRLKRLVRDSFRKIQHDLPEKDVVIMVRFGVLNLDNRQILNRLDRLWRKIIRLCEN